MTFFNDGGTVVYDTSLIIGTGAAYEGPTPAKNATASVHYSFREWVDEEGNALDLESLTATTMAYASYESTAHTMVMKNQCDPTCTEEGHTGDRECIVCGYVAEGSVIPSLGHDAVTEYGFGATCTEPGMTEGSYCDRCKETLAAQETIAPLGHSYAYVITKAPTLREEGTRTVICRNDAAHTYTESVAALSKALYFTFDGEKEERERYNNYVYNFTGFDQAEAWRGRTQGYKEGTAVLDSAAGTLTVKPGNTGFTSIFADSVNCDLNFDPEDADSYQIRFNAKGFTGKSCKVGMYFYYSTDNTYVAASSVAFGPEVLNGEEYFIATGKVADRVRNLDEVNRVVIYLSGFDAPADLLGELTLDYVYVGPGEDLPTPIYTVTFEDGMGNILDTQSVYKGEDAVYTGIQPTKPYDEINHYVFGGWDKELTNITADTTVFPTYIGIPHTYSEGECSCGKPEIKVPIEETKWKLGHSLNLASDISVNFAISKEMLAGFDMDTVYLLAELEIYEGSNKTGTKTVKLLPVEQGEYYYFTLNGLTAVQMNDRIQSVLYGTKDGQPYYSATDDYSIADYAYSQMNRSNMPKKLKVICADLLRYGTYAQIYKAYRTDALADAAKRK